MVGAAAGIIASLVPDDGDCFGLLVALTAVNGVYLITLLLVRPYAEALDKIFSLLNGFLGAFWGFLVLLHMEDTANTVNEVQLWFGIALVFLALPWAMVYRDVRVALCSRWTRWLPVGFFHRFRDGYKADRGEDDEQFSDDCDDDDDREITIGATASGNNNHHPRTVRNQEDEMPPSSERWGTRLLPADRMAERSPSPRLPLPRGTSPPRTSETVRRDTAVQLLRIVQRNTRAPRRAAERQENLRILITAICVVPPNATFQ